MKKCNKCTNSFPLNSDYFFRKKDTYDGFTSICKQCRGKNFTKKLQSPEGCKFCVKCNKNLEASPRFFPLDRACVEGIRNVCRKCIGRDYIEDYSPRNLWTSEENSKFVERYPHYTNEEMIEIFYPHMCVKKLAEKAYKLNVTKSEETYDRTRKKVGETLSEQVSPLIGTKFTKERKKRHARIFKEEYSGKNSYWYGRKRSEDERVHLSNIRKNLGRWKGEKNPRHLTPLRGERNGRWEGGATSETNKMRNSREYTQWKNDVFKRDGYSCQYCGDDKGGNLEAHHIENFSTIVDKRFDISNGITFCSFHHNPIHKGSFHNINGTLNNNLEQLRKYFSGVSWEIKTKKICNKPIKVIKV